MELDTIKTLWEKVNRISEKNQITQEKIIGILKKTSKGAMNNLINYELLGIGLALPMAFLVYFIFGIGFFSQFQTVQYLKWIYIGYCIFYFIWNIYKYIFLKKIDLMQMSMVEISKKMLVYRKYIVKEARALIVFCIVVSIPSFYIIYDCLFGKTIIVPIILYCISLYVLSIFLSIYLYKKLYFNNIKKIQESLAELEAFQKETEE